MILCKSISKKVVNGNQENTILKNISLEVKPNEFVAIKGSSGSGKTTLLGLIAALDRPTDGLVQLDGVCLNDMSADELTQFRCDHIGIIFQDFNLIESLSVKENVEFPTFFSNKHSNDVDFLLKQVGLQDKRSTKVALLSGGEKQRVAIARALVNKPRYILADEPTGSLDEENTKNILNLLVDLKERYEVTILLVTHDDRIAEIADRVVVLEDGKIVEE